MTVQPRWMLAPGFIAGVVVAVIFATAGLVLARLDIALLALPLIAASAWAWDRRPDEAGEIATDVTLADRADGGELGYVVSVSSPERVDAVCLRLTTLRGRPQEILVTAAAATNLRGTVPILHSGPQEMLRVEHRLVGVDAAMVSSAQGPFCAEHVVPPTYKAMRWLPLPGRLHGLTGTHDSSRPGDGGDFRDVHPFTPGDRLRRIDWKATARRGQFASDLFVRRTVATSDVTVLLALDSHIDVGEQVVEWSANRPTVNGTSCLDLAREAASSIAAGYIRAGDRVGFVDLASTRRMVEPGGGSRHLWRLLRVIELTSASETSGYRQRRPTISPGMIVYLLSSFLDDDMAESAILWRRSGHRVIAVDVLPAPRFDRGDRHDKVAHRIVMMTRADRLRTLQAYGVDIMRWQDDDESLPRDAALRILSRPGRVAR